LFEQGVIGEIECLKRRYQPTLLSTNKITHSTQMRPCDGVTKYNARNTDRLERKPGPKVAKVYLARVWIHKYSSPDSAWVTPTTHLTTKGVPGLKIAPLTGPLAPRGSPPFVARLRRVFRHATSKWLLHIYASKPVIPGFRFRRQGSRSTSEYYALF
jgi:hypothetical protein